MLDKHGSETNQTRWEVFDEEHYRNKLSMFNVTDGDRSPRKIKGDVYV